MKAPPLPEVFGNYALGEDFAEVSPTTAIDWWPQTSGWYVVAGLAMLFLLRYCFRLGYRWHRNRYRREALTALEQLAASATGDILGDPVDTPVNGPLDNLPAALSQLLKRTALAAFPRRDVASLYGDDWVAFLNQHCDKAPFSGAAALSLARGQYQPAVLIPSERKALIDACRQWLINHRGPKDA